MARSEIGCIRKLPAFRLTRKYRGTGISFFGRALPTECALPERSMNRPMDRLFPVGKEMKRKLKLRFQSQRTLLRQSHCQRHGFHNCGAKAAEKKLLPLLRGQCRQKTAWRLNLAPEIIFFRPRFRHRRTERICARERHPADDAP